MLVLRKSLGLSLDDLLAVVREFIHPTVSRAALHRMLKRHGVSAREALSVDRPRTKPFKAYEPGFVHIDVKYLPQMADETTRRYLFVWPLIAPPAGCSCVSMPARALPTPGAS